jgi:hypothetical protein
MIDWHFWKFVRHLKLSFSQLTGVLAVTPLSYRRYAYQYADGRERREASEPASCADLGRDTATHRFQAFY